MNILYVITKSDLGGAQTHLLDLLRYFSVAHQVVLAVGDEGFLTERARILGVQVQVLNNLVHPISPIRDLLGIAELRALMREFRPDIVHLHSSKAGIVGRVAARLENVPAVFTAHGWAFSPGVPLFRKLIALPVEWLMSRFCGAIINVSAFDRGLALGWGVGRRTDHHVIHNGVPDITPLQPIPHMGFVIVMTARFGGQKNQRLLLEALLQLPPDVRVRFLGDGPTRCECERLTAEFGLSARVEFLGNRLDVPTILAEADVFVLTSYYEGFPISILEAMRSRLPVIASNVGGVHEAVLEGRNGMLVKDLDSLVAAIRRLYETPTLLLAMATASREIYCEQFAETIMLAKIEALYRLQCQSAVKT